MPHAVLPAQRPRSPVSAARAAIAGWTGALAAQFRDASRGEAICLALATASLVLSLGVTVAQATLAPVVLTEKALRRAAVSVEFEGGLCPDGWAARHAAVIGMTEAEVTAWYLREAMEMSDRAVISAVGLYLTNATDFRQIEGLALTRNQIYLCIAESRRMTQPFEELLPPDLRRGGGGA